MFLATVGLFCGVENCVVREWLYCLFGFCSWDSLCAVINNVFIVLLRVNSCPKFTALAHFGKIVIAIWVFLWSGVEVVIQDRCEMMSSSWVLLDFRDDASCWHVLICVRGLWR